MNAEFFKALDLLEKEKGIPKEFMIERVEAALVSAFKKDNGFANVRVVLDPVKKDVKVYKQLEKLGFVGLSDNFQLSIFNFQFGAIAR